MVSRRNKDNDTFSDYLLDPLNDYSGKFTNINSETTKANNNLTKWIQNFNRTLQGIIHLNLILLFQLQI